MPNSIAFARNYVSVIDEVYQRAGVSGVLNSGRRMVRAGHNAKEVMIPKISVTELGDYTRNVEYKTGSITYEFKTHSLDLAFDHGETVAGSPLDSQASERSGGYRRFDAGCSGKMVERIGFAQGKRLEKAFCV